MTKKTIVKTLAIAGVAAAAVKGFLEVKKAKKEEESKIKSQRRHMHWR